MTSKQSFFLSFAAAPIRHKPEQAAGWLRTTFPALRIAYTAPAIRNAGTAEEIGTLAHGEHQGHDARTHLAARPALLPRVLVLVALAMALAAPTVCWPAPPPKASQYYEDALVRYEKKDLAGAIIQVKNALQIDNAMLQGHLLLGRALLQNSELAAAEVALLEALRLGVNRAEVAPQLAQVYLGQGKHKQIFERPEVRLEGLPTDVRMRMLLLRSVASSDLGDPHEAMRAVEEARAIDPKSADSWIAEVPIRIRNRQFPAANAAAERALSLAPDAPEAWYQKATVHHVTGDIPQALAAYDRVLKENPDHIEARIARAGVYIDQGRFAEAAVDVEELRRVSPKEPRAAYLRALLAERDNRPEEVKKALGEVTALIDPVPLDFIRYRPQFLMLNGLAHFGLNQNEKAREYLEAFQRFQGNTAAAKLLAQLYLNDGRTDRAIEVLEAYLKVQSADGQAMILLGTALMERGQNARAISLMRQALQTRDAPEFRTLLGLNLIRTGQAAGGVAELEAAWAKNRTQTQAGTALVSLYLQVGQAKKAIEVAESLVKQQPANALFHNLLGVAKRQAGDRAGAKVAFEQATKLDGAFVAPKLNLARIEIADKAYDAAGQRLSAILKANEKNSEALFEMAVLSERQGKTSDALGWLKKAVDHSRPKEARWALALADFQMRQGQPGPALEAAKIATSKSPDNLSVLMVLAQVQLANGDLAGAKNSLATATRVADFDPKRQVAIALLQLRANNLDGASYSLEKALSGQPDFLPAQALMAEIELRRGDVSKAESRARDIVAKRPQLAIGHSLLGDIAVSRGNLSAALDAYRKAHQVEPSTDTLLRLNRAMAGQGQEKQAQQLAEQWLKTHPRDLQVMRILADGYARVGNYMLARTAYEKLISVSPGDGAVLNNLANVLQRLKDPSALKVAEEAVAKSPGNPNAIDTLGWILFQQGQSDRALRLLRDVRLRQPENPVIRYHLAAVLAQSGRRGEAREELEAALKIGRKFDEVHEAEALLSTLK